MVQGIYFLSTDDFSLKETDKGNSLFLKHNTKISMNLVLFYSNSCEHCDSIMTDFKVLPKSIIGCSFSMINVLTNPEVIQLSRDSISPITYVPDLYLFINGLPYMRYEGEINLNDIKTFILEISAKMKNSFAINTEQNIQNTENKFKDDLITSSKEQTKSPPSIIQNYLGNINSHNELQVVQKKINKKNKKVCYLKGNDYVCS